MQSEEFKLPQLLEENEIIEWNQKAEGEEQETEEQLLAEILKIQALLDQDNGERVKKSENHYQENQEDTKANEEVISAVNRKELIKQFVYTHKEQKYQSFPRMDEQFFRRLLSDFRTYYSTKELNEKLFLNHKGFKYIENLDKFTELRCIYLEGNMIERIEGLDNCTKLRSVYLQENSIKKIENMDSLKDLVNLNLSENYIETIENLEKLPKLQTLIVSKNRIGKNGIADIELCSQLLSLTQVVHFSVLDVQENKIDDPKAIEVFKQMPKISVLYTQNNPYIVQVSNFRKVILNDIKSLKFLNDRPIFEDDRRFAQAFCRGGVEEERAEVKKWNDEKDEERRRYHEEFSRMFNAQREEAKMNQNQQRGQQNQRNLENLEVGSQRSTDCSIENNQIQIQSTSPTNSTQSIQFSYDQANESQQELQSEKSQEIIDVHIQQQEHQKEEEQSSFSNMLKITPLEQKENNQESQQVQRVLIEEMPGNQEQIQIEALKLDQQKDQLNKDNKNQILKQLQQNEIESPSYNYNIEKQIENQKQTEENNDQECIDLDELD